MSDSAARAFRFTLMRSPSFSADSTLKRPAPARVFASRASAMSKVASEALKEGVARKLTTAPSSPRKTIWSVYSGT